MMNVRLLLPPLVLALCGHPAAAASETPDTTIWDRRAALDAARSVDTLAVRQELYHLTVAGSAMDVLHLLEDTAGRADWPLPARESAIFRYTTDLRTLPPSSVPNEVMDYLQTFPARTLVPHEDHPQGGVPLFNVRGAASGVRNEWRRQEAVIEGLALLASNPRSLVDAFALESHRAVHGGYLDALEQAGDRQLRNLARHAAERVRKQPALTPLAGRAALKAADLPSLQEVLVHGRGPALAGLLRDAARQLDRDEAASLLLGALEEAPTATAALALAELAPRAAGDPAVHALLLNRLDDPDLGAAAALALTRHPAPETVRELEHIAGGAAGPVAAARAKLALSLHLPPADERSRP